MQKFDLHCHTSCSDGSTRPEVLAVAAHRLGLSGIAISDHDTMNGVLRAQHAAGESGLLIIPAVELSCFDFEAGRKVHILVYAPCTLEPLQVVFEQMSQKRNNAGEQMIELVSRKYPITREMVLSYVEPGCAIYRTHIMRALMALGYCSSIYGALYDGLFSQKESCRVSVCYTDAWEGARAARDSGGIVTLAHPGVYNSFSIGAQMAQAGLLDAVEYDYPRRKPHDLPLLDGLINQYHLLKSGGTDFHGYCTPAAHPVGTCISSEQMAEKILEHMNVKRSKGQ